MNNDNDNLYSASICHVVALMAHLHIKHPAKNITNANKASFLDPKNIYIINIQYSSNKNGVKFLTCIYNNNKIKVKKLVS